MHKKYPKMAHSELLAEHTVHLRTFQYLRKEGRILKHYFYVQAILCDVYQ